MKYSFQIIAAKSNEELRSLVKEIKKMSNMDKPATHKKSEAMKELFEVEKNLRYWCDKYHAIKSAIVSEVVYRIEKDAM